MSSEFISGVEYPRPFDELVVELCNTAARHLYILSPTLDHDVFDNPELITAISALIRRSRQTEVHILVGDSRSIIARGHRLVELARKLSSSIVIRKLAEHPDWNGETIVIRDRDGVLYKSGGADHNAFYEPGSRSSTQQHLDLFQELWRYSTEDSNLRTLSL